MAGWACGYVGGRGVGGGPVNLEWRGTNRLELGSHEMFLARVEGVAIDGKYMDEKGKFHLNDSGLVGYSHGEYFELGKKLGSFGWSVREKERGGRRS